MWIHFINREKTKSPKEMRRSSSGKQLNLFFDFNIISFSRRRLHQFIFKQSIAKNFNKGILVGQHYSTPIMRKLQLDLANQRVKWFHSTNFFLFHNRTNRVRQRRKLSNACNSRKEKSLLILDQQSKYAFTFRAQAQSWQISFDLTFFTPTNSYSSN